MGVTVQEFLRRKGGVGLLSVLNERGKSFSEIETEVEITSDTISKRKDEAMELGLIELKPARRENGTVSEYHLSDLGEALVHKMAMKGIVSNYRSMRTHQREIEEKTDEVVEWVYQNPSQLMQFTEAHEETLIDRRADVDSENDEADGDGGRTETWGSTEEQPDLDEDDMDDLLEESDGGGNSEE